MDNKNKTIKLNTTKKKKYILGITGICILAIIMFLVYKFKFSESHVEGRESCEVIVSEKEYTAYIKVDEWMPIGFSGYVVESEQEEIYERNSLIKIEFLKDVEVVYTNGKKFEYYEEEANANKCLIESGSTVQVKYHAYESVNRNGDDDKIYAEKVIENGK